MSGLTRGETAEFGFARRVRLSRPAPACSSLCVCVCVFFPSILDIKFVGRTSRGHTGGRSHRIFNPPSFCGACLDFCREKDSATQPESGAYLRDSSRVPRRRPFIYLKTAIRHRVSPEFIGSRNCVLTDGVHCRESADTAPVNLKVVPNGCCLGRSPWANY